ncbi:MAG: flippase-like domain-containing protein [Rhodobacterales bacterium]|nr:flippase-like domain-containing protein [Rhodobacterales bacterium]
MRALKIIYWAVGLGLLALVLTEVDTAAVARHVAHIGWAGLGVVLGIHFLSFMVDTVVWQLTLLVPLTPRWLARSWAVKMIGEVFNAVIPAGGMGGEPLKASLLKDRHGIAYRDSMASIILRKTINMGALVVFLMLGFVVVLRSGDLPAGYKTVAALGLAAFALGGVLFFAIQRWRVTSLTGTWLARWPVARRIEAVLHHVHDMEGRLIAFYTGHRGRLWLALVLSLGSWFLGVAEVYAAMGFLGHPVGWGDAWIIETLAQLVRAGAFFIPAAIGAQEGTFLLVVSAITGSADLGLAAGVVRRLREIVWLVWGVAVGGWLSLKGRKLPVQ